MRALDPSVYIIALLAAAVAVRLLLGGRRRRGKLLGAPWPLETKRHLLSERERALYQRLVQALPEHVVLAQVQLLQVIQFRRGRRSRAIQNRFSQLSLDFLVVDRETRPVAAIELDDATHERPDRRLADARKSHALQSAGLPLIRWNARSLPESEAIRAAVLSPTNGKATGR